MNICVQPKIYGVLFRAHIFVRFFLLFCIEHFKHFSDAHEINREVKQNKNTRGE